jgi:competence protein ComEA
MSSKMQLKRFVTMGLAALGIAAALAGAPADVSAQRARRAEPAAEQAQSAEGVVNIQTATLEQLQLLPGIGPSKAQAIVSAREQRAFRRVEDILRVRGIGRATFRRLRPMITVEGPTTLTENVRSTPRQEASAEEGSEE